MVESLREYEGRVLVDAAGCIYIYLHTLLGNSQDPERTSLVPQYRYDPFDLGDFPQDQNFHQSLCQKYENPNYVGLDKTQRWRQQ